MDRQFRIPPTEEVVHRIKSLFGDNHGYAVGLFVEDVEGEGKVKSEERAMQISAASIGPSICPEETPCP